MAQRQSKQANIGKDCDCAKPKVAICQEATYYPNRDEIEFEKSYIICDRCGGNIPDHRSDVQ